MKYYCKDCGKGISVSGARGMGRCRVCASTGKNNNAYGKPSHRRGKTLSTEHKNKISLSNTGVKSSQYKDGFWSNYRKWKKLVNERDNYACQVCGKQKHELKYKWLHTHHIKSRKTHKELSFEVSNGITLCQICHRKYEKKPNKLQEFII